MKIETALKVLNNRAKWYGLGDNLPKYLDLIQRCGCTEKEEQALDTLRKFEYEKIMSVIAGVES